MRLSTFAPLFLNNRLTEITLYTTGKCNFSCAHCFVARRLNKKYDELTLDELKKIGSFVPALQRISLSGGEPFLRKDIKEMAVLFSNSWRAEHVVIPTNGHFTKNITETIEHFGKNGKGRLRILFSLTGIGKEMEAFVRVPGSFERWKQSLASAKDAAKDCPNVELGVLSSYHEQNQDRFFELMDFVMNECGIEDFSFALVRPHKRYRPTLNLDRFEYYKKRNKQPAFTRAYRELYREMLLSYYRNPRMIVPCQSGKMRIVISPEGDVYPCETLGFPADHPEPWHIGNLRESGYNLSNLMRSSRAQTLHRKIVRDKCHCHDGCDLSLSLLASTPFKLKIFFRGMKYLMMPSPGRGASG